MYLYHILKYTTIRIYIKKKYNNNKDFKFINISYLKNKIYFKIPEVKN